MDSRKPKRRRKLPQKTRPSQPAATADATGGRVRRTPPRVRVGQPDGVGMKKRSSTTGQSYGRKPVGPQIFSRKIDGAIDGVVVGQRKLPPGSRPIVGPQVFSQKISGGIKKDGVVDRSFPGIIYAKR